MVVKNCFSTFSMGLLKESKNTGRKGLLEICSVLYKSWRMYRAANLWEVLWRRESSSIKYNEHPTLKWSVLLKVLWKVVARVSNGFSSSLSRFSKVARSFADNMVRVNHWGGMEGKGMVGGGIEMKYICFPWKIK